MTSNGNAQELRSFIEHYIKFRACYDESWELDHIQQCIAALRSARAILEGTTGLSNEPRQLVPEIDASTTDLSLRQCIFLLSVSLGDQYMHTGAVKHLDERLELLRNVRLPGDSNQMTASLIDLELGRAHLQLFLRTQHMEELNQSCSFLSSSLSNSPVDHPWHPWVLLEYGRSLAARYTTSGDNDDLELSTKLYQDALLLSTATAPGYLQAWVFDGLGSILLGRYIRDSVPGDLHTSLKYCENALDILPSNHRDRYMVEKTCGSSLAHLYRMTRDSDYLHRALHSLRRAFSGVERHHPNCSGIVLVLSGNLYHLWGTTGELKDLQEGVDLLRSQVQLTKHTNPALMSQLAFLLNQFFSSTGSDSALDESIVFHRRGLALHNPKNPQIIVGIVNYAISLYLRYQAHGRLRDCNEAITLLRGALTDPESLPKFYRLKLRSMLAWALSEVSSREIMCSRIYEAITLADLWREEVEAPGGLEFASDPAHGYGTMAAIYLQSFSLDGLKEHITTSIHCWNVSLGHCGTKDRQIFHSYLGLSRALIKRFQSLGVHDDAEEAKLVLEKACSTIPPEAFSRFFAFSEFAKIYLVPDTAFYSVSLALDYLQQTLQHGSPYLGNCLFQVMEIFLMLEKEIPYSASRELQQRLLNSYIATTELLPRLVYFGLDAKSRLHALGEKLDQLAVLAAARASVLAKVETAVELLEHGRALLWSQHLKMQVSLQGLPSGIATELRDSALLLSRGYSKIEQDSDTSKDQDLRHKFEGLISKARQTPGFERFLLPDTFAILSTAASSSPIAIFLATSTIALVILMNGLSSPKCIRLPNVTSPTLKKLANEVSTAGGAVRKAMTRRGCKVIRKGVATRTLEDILAILWDEIVQYVVTGLSPQDSSSARKRPRIILCPTGAFIRLPLHAAGRTNGTSMKEITLGDFFVSSYTPSIGALINSQRKPSLLYITEAKALFLAVSHPPSGWQNLPYAAEEVRRIESTITRRENVTIMSDGGRTKIPVTISSVSEKLSESSIIHFACHGHHSSSSVLESGFLLSDGMLTIAMLMALRMDNAFLAFLSACETAKGSKSQPDQVIHLAATMLFSGFRSVIGTMWSMNDVDGPEVATMVYNELFRKNSDIIDSEAIPYALDAAVRQMRAKNISASRWALYVHFGA